MNKNRFWLLLVILMALALRSTLLGEQSLWYDEGVTWLLSQMSPLELIRWTAADIQPPLYYLLLWVTTRLFGSSEWALRFPSAASGGMTVPLIYILARRLFSVSSHHPISAPFLAAILLAISPVMVYYGQEARMYTLLIFEGTLASYLLLKILHAESAADADIPSFFNLQSLPFYYALTTTAALYTHYFAVFLLIGHSLYSLFILWRHGFSKRLVIQLLQILGIVILLFALWVSVLSARWGDDPSYWPGALKLHEALRKVFINFTVGETVLEQTGFRLALGYLLLLLICLVYGRLNASACQQKSNPNAFKLSSFTRSVHPSSLFLILWLLLPISLILMLSYQSPKFNPRYTLLSWPAFALILTAGLTNLLENTTSLNRQSGANSTSSVPRPPSPVPRLPSTVSRLPSTISYLPFLFAVLFILATSVFSLYNWFTDPRFAKDDFQALTQFVRERIAPDETVLLSSGHMFPVWAYYYGWQGWAPLPPMERLNVNRVTDLSISPEMAKALQGKGGAWLVSWQDEVIDPTGVVPFWLDLIGRRPHDAGDFQGVRLEHWRLDPNKMELLHQNPIDRPAVSPSSASSETTPASVPSSYNFANQVDLLGMTQLSDTEMVLFWRPRRPLPDNLLLTFDLTDRDGFRWSRETFVGRPGAYLYPPSRWPVGQIVLTRQKLSWQVGTPPGLYIAEISLGQAAEANAIANFVGWDILDEQGRPLRRTALLDFVNLSGLIPPHNGSLSLPETPLVDFLPIIALRQSELSQTAAEPGDRILLTLLWQAGEFNFDDISIAFDLVDTQGQNFRVGSSLTPSRRFNLPRWHPGDIVRGQYWLNIPPEAAPGPATLQVRLVNVHGFRYDEIFPFEKLEILPTERNFTPPTAVDMPLEADFSGQVILIGADCWTPIHSDCRATPGESVTLTLYWRAETPLDTNYTIFTHLFGPDETPLVIADHSPSKPTQGWVSGEIIADTVTLTLPDDLTPGDYLIEVGLYNAADPAFPRLPLTTGEKRVVLPQTLKVE